MSLSSFSNSSNYKNVENKKFGMPNFEFFCGQ